MRHIDRDLTTRSQMSIQSGCISLERVPFHHLCPSDMLLTLGSALDIKQSHNQCKAAQIERLRVSPLMWSSVDSNV